MQLGIFANLYVFEAGTGAAWNNFSSHPGALVSQSVFLSYVNPAEALNETIFQSLSGTVSVR